MEWFKNADDKLEEKLIDFFKKNPYPEDTKVHEFAEELKIAPDKLEAAIYNILSSFLSEGKSKGKDIKVDEAIIKKGVKVEMEHTTSLLIAMKIVMDHLVESKDYYEYLEKMEKEMEKAKEE